MKTSLRQARRWTQRERWVAGLRRLWASSAMTRSKSILGLPARAVRTPWLARYLKRVEQLRAHASEKAHKCTLAWDCLLQCGLRNNIAKFGQFCIDNQLAAALRGDVEKGLFFRGSEPLPFGAAIRPVRELIAYFLTGQKPEAVAA